MGKAAELQHSRKDRGTKKECDRRHLLTSIALLDEKVFSSNPLNWGILIVNGSIFKQKQLIQIIVANNNHILQTLLLSFQSDVGRRWRKMRGQFC
jgi:hypothetical protein